MRKFQCASSVQAVLYYKPVEGWHMPARREHNSTFNTIFWYPIGGGLAAFPVFIFGKKAHEVAGV